MSTLLTAIHQRNEYIIGLVTPAIGPNKSKKLTRDTYGTCERTLTVPHNSESPFHKKLTEPSVTYTKKNKQTNKQKQKQKENKKVVFTIPFNIDLYGY